MFKEDNGAIRHQILQAVEGLSDEQLNVKPAQGKWSVMQILDHLQLMEQVIARNIQKELEQGSSKKVMKKPIQWTVSRIIKVDAPFYTVPSEEFMRLEEMKEKLSSSRIFLNRIYDNTPYEILKTKSMHHPVFGRVSLIQWFSFIGYHEKRHLKQLKDVLRKLDIEKNGN